MKAQQHLVKHGYQYLATKEKLASVDKYHIYRLNVCLNNDCKEKVQVFTPNLDTHASISSSKKEMRKFFTSFITLYVADRRKNL